MKLEIKIPSFQNQETNHADPTLEFSSTAKHLQVRHGCQWAKRSCQKSRERRKNKEKKK